MIRPASAVTSTFRGLPIIDTMIGFPLAGDRILLTDIIKTRASICASTDSGTWTAI